MPQIKKQFDVNRKGIAQFIQTFAATNPDAAQHLQNLIDENIELIRIQPDLLPSYDSVIRDPVIRQRLVDFDKNQARINQLINYFDCVSAQLSSFAEELAEVIEQQDRLFSQAISDCNRKEHHQ